jgi:hypothetical protein
MYVTGYVYAKMLEINMLEQSLYAGTFSYPDYMYNYAGTSSTIDV